MRTLDKTKPFATICGQMDNGARYEQDGLQFDAHGRCVADREYKPPAQPARDVRSTSAADPALHEQLQRQGSEGEPGTLVIGNAGTASADAAASTTADKAAKAVKADKPKAKPAKRKAKAR